MQIGREQGEIILFVTCYDPCYDPCCARPSLQVDMNFLAALHDVGIG
jgi:hypothetical protein